MTAAVLVLNATYEPLSHTRLARAISLVANGHAVVEEIVPGRVIRHAGGFIPWPKVLRMLRFVKRPYTHKPAKWSKRGVLRRDSNRCGYCGRSATTIDHIVPLSRGGDPRGWLNTVAACVKCNNRKDNKTPAEAGMELLITPSVPFGY